MAREIIQRSGGIFVIGTRARALCVDVDEGTIGAIMNAQSLIAHLVVAEPWRVIRNRRHLPALVAEALDRFRAPGPTL